MVSTDSSFDKTKIISSYKMTTFDYKVCKMPYGITNKYFYCTLIKMSNNGLSNFYKMRLSAFSFYKMLYRFNFYKCEDIKY